MYYVWTLIILYLRQKYDPITECYENEQFGATVLQNVLQLSISVHCNSAAIPTESLAVQNQQEQRNTHKCQIVNPQQKHGISESCEEHQKQVRETVW